MSFSAMRWRHKESQWPAGRNVQIRALLGASGTADSRGQKSLTKAALRFLPPGNQSADKIGLLPSTRSENKSTRRSDHCEKPNADTRWDDEAPRELLIGFDACD